MIAKSIVSLRTIAVTSLLVAAIALFVALGLWQVRRLAWKEALIARVDAALQAPALDGEGLARVLAKDGPGGLEYRHARLEGRYQPEGTALVFTATDLGSGYWVLTPLRLAGRGLIYVNRGFVPVGRSLASVRATTPLAPVTVTGLIRLTEPGGTWLRRNNPGHERWYSRDVAAIAASHGLAAESRLFVDAQAENPPAGPGAPVPGLTQLVFPNSHRAYALTWFALALMCAGGLIVLWRART